MEVKELCLQVRWYVDSYWVVKIRISMTNSFSSRLSSADDTIIFPGFFVIKFVTKCKKVQNFWILCPYLESALKMHQNEYKQAYVWSSGSWKTSGFYEKTLDFHKHVACFLLKHVLSVVNLKQVSNGTCFSTDAQTPRYLPTKHGFMQNLIYMMKFSQQNALLV